VANPGVANETCYFHRDYLRSVNVVTNNAGTVIERMSFDGD
jgi:hypothetical protein